MDYQLSSKDSIDFDAPLYNTNTSVVFSSTSDKDLEDSSSIESNNVASSRISLATNASEMSNNGDSLPKSFLQLKGISITNYNMECNLNIASALWIIIQ